MKSRKLPPYVDLCIIKMRDGNLEDVDAVLDVIINNVRKDRSTKKGKILKWSKSIQEYWEWVFNQFVSALNDHFKKDKKGWKNWLNTIQMKLGING